MENWDFKDSNNNKDSTFEEQTFDKELKPRKKMKPILKKLTQVRTPLVHYLGVSYGLTKELFGFWQRNGFSPVYLR